MLCYYIKERQRFQVKFKRKEIRRQVTNEDIRKEDKNRYEEKKIIRLVVTLKRKLKKKSKRDCKQLKRSKRRQNNRTATLNTRCVLPRYSRLKNDLKRDVLSNHVMIATMIAMQNEESKQMCSGKSEVRAPTESCRWSM